MMQDKIDTAPVNHLLAGLPAALQDRLRSHLELTELQKDDVVFTSDGDNKYVFFPLTSSISLAHWRVDGRLVEISLVGNEGVIGIPLLLIGTIVPCRAVVHTSGSAYRLPAALFQQELNRGGPFPRNFIHYADRLMLQLESSDYCDVHGIADRTTCAECGHADACPERVRATAGTIFRSNAKRSTWAVKI